MDRDDDFVKEKYSSRLEEEEDNSQQDFGEFPDMGVEGSVKKEWSVRNFYLPNTHHAQIDDIYRDLRYETDDKLQKGRHFYPALVALGLEHIEGMGVSEVKELLERIDREASDD